MGGFVWGGGVFLAEGIRCAKGGYGLVLCGNDVRYRRDVRVRGLQTNSAKAGITRKGGIHTLRHCFAAHLLGAGVDIRTTQLLMGHSSILTTVRYLQVISKKLQGTQSPLDLLVVTSDSANQ